VEATVTSIEIAPCGTMTGVAGGTTAQPSPDPSVPPCRGITFAVEEGRDAGQDVAIELPDVSTSPDLQVGERVILERPRMKVPGMPYGLYDRSSEPGCAPVAITWARS
jgi:hypothetical protein